LAIGLDNVRVTKNIKLLSEFERDFSSIRIVENSHGLELVSEKGSNYSPEIVWTAYPGRITSTVTRHPAKHLERPITAL